MLGLTAEPGTKGVAIVRQRIREWLEYLPGWSWLPIAILLWILAVIIAVRKNLVAWDKAEVQAALVSSTVLIFSVLISYIGFIYTPRRLKALEFKLNYVERQMSELYGPVLGILLSTQQAYYAALRAVGFDNDAINSIEQGEAYLDSYAFFHPKWENTVAGKSFDSYNERYFIPTNAMLRRLIGEKYHLIGPEPRYRPEAFEEFLKHEAEFRIRFERWKEKREVDCGPGVEWPPRFLQDVRDKLDVLALLQSNYRLQIQGKRPPRKDVDQIRTLLQKEEQRYKEAQARAGHQPKRPRRVPLPDTLVDSVPRVMAQKGP